jgi:CHAD domain-containing protein
MAIRRHRATAIAATPSANAPNPQSGEEKDIIDATGMNRDYNLLHP